MPRHESGAFASPGTSPSQLERWSSGRSSGVRVTRWTGCRELGTGCWARSSLRCVRSPMQKRRACRTAVVVPVTRMPARTVQCVEIRATAAITMALPLRDPPVTQWPTATRARPMAVRTSRAAITPTVFASIARACVGGLGRPVIPAMAVAVCSTPAPSRQSVRSRARCRGHRPTRPCAAVRFAPTSPATTKNAALRVQCNARLTIRASRKALPTATSGTAASRLRRRRRNATR